MSRRVHNGKSRSHDELLFGDSFELDHVIELLHDYAKLADLSLTQDKVESLRDDSPLPVLERKLQSMLIDSGVLPADVEDWNEVRWLLKGALNNLQQVCAETLELLFKIETPFHLAEHLPALQDKLRRVHAVTTDTHIDEYDVAQDYRNNQSKKAKKTRGDALSKEIEKILRRIPDATWKDVLTEFERHAGEPDEIIDKITEQGIVFYDELGKKKNASISGLKDRVSRIRNRRKQKSQTG